MGAVQGLPRWVPSSLPGASADSPGFPTTSGPWGQGLGLGWNGEAVPRLRSLGEMRSCWGLPPLEPGHQVLLEIRTIASPSSPLLGQSVTFYLSPVAQAVRYDPHGTNL